MTSLEQTPQKLSTQRLLLRTPCSNDAPAIAKLAHNPKIAEMTATIPYPYPLTAAESWIKHVQEQRQQGNIAAYLICHHEDQQVMGVISLRRFSDGDVNLAYWLGEHYWGHGFCTEAGVAILHMAKQFEIQPVIARHLASNEASKSVLLRLGFQKVGSETSLHRNTQQHFICYTLQT